MEHDPIKSTMERKVHQSLTILNNIQTPEIEGTDSHGRFIYGPDWTLESLQTWVGSHQELLDPYLPIEDGKGNIQWINDEGNPIERSVASERRWIDYYFATVALKRPEYVAYIQELTNSDHMGAMHADCRACVAIPSWLEGKNIYNLLCTYTQQKDATGRSIDPNLYEIAIIINRKKGTEPDETDGEIQRFMKDTNYQYNIKYIDVELPSPFNNVGTARKILTDVLLYRSSHRSSQPSPLYILSEDADLTGVDPSTISKTIEVFDARPEVCALVGIQDRTPEILQQNDLLFLYARFKDFRQIVLRHSTHLFSGFEEMQFRFGSPVTGGWNSSFRAEELAHIGGYDPVRIREDLVIGERIRMIHGNSKNENPHVVARIPIRSDSSPRRFILALFEDMHAYNDSFSDEVYNKDLKTQPVEKLLELIQPFVRIEDNPGKFEEMFTVQYLSLLDLHCPSDIAIDIFHKIMWGLGFHRSDYDIEDDHIILRNTSRIQCLLDRYRRRHQCYSTEDLFTRNSE